MLSSDNTKKKSNIFLEEKLTQAGQKTKYQSENFLLKHILRFAYKKTA